MIHKKTADQIALMAAAGRIHASCIRMLVDMVRPGVKTVELDRAAERLIRANGARPAFQGYRGFPGSICASPNDMVVHGIPGEYRLRGGDIISLDVGVELDGWIADGAITVPVAKVDAEVARLLEVTRASLDAGVAACRVGGRIGDIGHAVQTTVELAGFSIIRELIGHGVGRSMHEDPQVPNYGKPGTGPKLEEGMVIAIEPMVNIGGPGIRMANDGWSVYSADGSPAAHFEFTVAITADGPLVLTPWHLDDDRLS